MVCPPSATVPDGRVALYAAAVAVVLFAIELAWGPAPRDDVSFRTGYAAVEGAAARAAMTGSAMSVAAFCADIVDDVMSSAAGTDIVVTDFLAGCRRAVVDAME